MDHNLLKRIMPSLSPINKNIVQFVKQGIHMDPFYTEFECCNAIDFFY